MRFIRNILFFLFWKKDIQPANKPAFVQTNNTSVWTGITFGIKPAFTWNGETYFEFEGELPVERALTALHIFEEIQSNFSKELVLAGDEAILEVIEKPDYKNKIRDIVHIVTERKQLIKCTVSLDIIYHLASVVFVSANENILAFDPMFAKAKIKKWQMPDESQKEVGKEALHAFFLKLPIGDYLPDFLKSNEDIDNSLNVSRKLTLRHVEKLHSILKHVPENPFTYSVASQIETLKDLIP